MDSSISEQPKIDLELFQLARAGSSDAMGQLLDCCRSSLRATAEQRMTREIQKRESPSDAVQLTFKKALNSFGNFRGQSYQELLIWLRTILVNQISDLRDFHHAALRSVYREKELPDSRIQPNHGLVSISPGPDRKAQLSEDFLRLQQVINTLPEKQKAVIQLHNLQGLPFSEVAVRLNLSENGCRFVWYTALESIRRKMQSSGCHG